MTEAKLGKAPEKAPHKSCQNGCYLLFIASIIFIWLLVAVGYFFIEVLPKIRASAEVREHKAIWEAYGLTDYTISFTGGGLGGSVCAGRIVVVRDNELIEVRDRRDTQNQGVIERKDFQECTIEGLFELALNCQLFCVTRYNPSYGYPEFIGGGFIESTSLEVVDFLPNE